MDKHGSEVCSDQQVKQDPGQRRVSFRHKVYVSPLKLVSAGEPPALLWHAIPTCVPVSQSASRGLASFLQALQVQLPTPGSHPSGPSFTGTRVGLALRISLFTYWLFQYKGSQK